MLLIGFPAASIKRKMFEVFLNIVNEAVVLRWHCHRIRTISRFYIKYLVISNYAEGKHLFVVRGPRSN